MGIARTLLAVAIAASLLGTATDFVAPAEGRDTKSKATRTKVYVTKRWPTGADAR
jgi:hypothetical protein